MRSEGLSMTSIQSRNRVGGFGASTNSNGGEPGRNSTRSLATALGSGSSTWHSHGGNIWGNSTPGGMMPNNKPQDELPTDVSSRDIRTGSGSLLSSSELDNTNARSDIWKARDSASDFPSMAAPHARGSPDTRYNNGPYKTTSFAESTNPESIFALNQGSSLSGRSSQKVGLDPTSRDFVAAEGIESGGALSSRNNSESDMPYAFSHLHFSRADSSMSSVDRPSRLGNSGYNSSTGSRNGSLPQSRTDFDPASLSSNNLGGETQNARTPLQFLNPAIHQRSSFSNNAGALPLQPGQALNRSHEQTSYSRLDNLAGQMSHMAIQNPGRRPSYPSSQHSPNSTTELFQNARQTNGINHHPWSADEPASTDEQLSSGSNIPAIPRNHAFRNGLDGTLSSSPGDVDARWSRQSPPYSTAETPHNFHSQSNTSRGSRPSPSVAPPMILDQRLRGLQQQQQSFQPQQAHGNLRNQMNFSYDNNSQQMFSMNPLASYYPMAPAPHLLANSQAPRGSIRDQDPAGHLRSPLLEDFRNNSRTNKHYDLKDIYDHIVEFSGDQHGSRFIQQKLETANSDQKDQVFRELLPNAFQLMTDVFGNYVIQKFFEHGSQAQKKTLANQMKNRVFALSTQMYGCRVVQKALEHVLTDQQAELIKELEHEVMRCVRDQNGNHVIQKAIERIPAEHIQFIINAFRNRVGENAVHPYGCRVIQRMLEHCDETTRLSVLTELHMCASSLICDQYGNYVTQHVIQHGRAEDRGKVINLVTSNLINYSKHKFASNVVEKSIEFGAFEERQQIIRKLIQVNDRGENPLQTLIRDQYGNYVIQKILNQLQGHEWTDFAEPVKTQVAILKRFAYGKHVANVEKLLYRGQVSPQVQGSGMLTPAIESSAAATPPLMSDHSQSPQSSSQPSVHANSIDVFPDSRKSSGEVVSVLTPELSM